MTSGSTFIDFGELYEEVTIRGKKHRVSAITAAGLFYLIGAVPEIKAFMSGKMEDFTPQSLAEKAPDSLAKMIACGMVDRVDFKKDIEWHKAIVVAAVQIEKLSFAEQLNLLTKIFSLTFSEGTGPFVEQLTRLTSAFSEVAASLPGTQAPDTPSTGTSSGLFQMEDGQKMMRGTLAPAN